MGYYSGPTKVKHQPGAMGGGGVCLLTPHITGWRSGGGGLVSSHAMFETKAGGEECLACLPCKVGGRGRDYPVLEFLNNLWVLGTE